jgi:hypothetical protein
MILKSGQQLIQRKGKGQVMEVVIYGAGLLGQKVYEILKEQSTLEIVGFIDDDPWKMDSSICELKVVGKGRDLPTLRKFGVEGIVVAISDGEVRLWISKLSKKLGFQILSTVSKSASVSPDAKIHEGCILSEMVSVESNAIIGECCFLGSRSVVKSSSKIPSGSNVTSGSIITPKSYPEEDVERTTELGLERK